MKKLVLKIFFILKIFSLSIVITSCEQKNWVEYKNGLISIFILPEKSKQSYLPSFKVINDELEYQNNFLKYFENTYGLSLKYPIKIYLYPSEIAKDEIGSIGGGGVGSHTKFP